MYCKFILYFSMALVHEWHKNISTTNHSSKMLNIYVYMHVNMYVMALELKLSKQYTNTGLNLQCVFLKYLQAKDGGKNCFLELFLCINSHLHKQLIQASKVKCNRSTIGVGNPPNHPYHATLVFQYPQMKSLMVTSFRSDNNSWIVSQYLAEASHNHQQGLR